MQKLIAVLVLPASLALVAGCGGSGSSTSNQSTLHTGTAGGAAATGTMAKPVEVSSAPVGSLGQVLVDSEGKTLYVFARDKAKKVTCQGSCIAVWPPLKLEAGQKARASGKVRSSLLGSDPDPEGGEVVTYAGWPLYTFVSDNEPGKAVGQAVNLNGGFWYVITPEGKVVK